jgi:hypothetical protein
MDQLKSLTEVNEGDTVIGNGRDINGINVLGCRGKVELVAHGASEVTALVEWTHISSASGPKPTGITSRSWVKVDYLLKVHSARG